MNTLEALIWVAEQRADVSFAVPRKVTVKLPNGQAFTASTFLVAVIAARDAVAKVRLA